MMAPAAAVAALSALLVAADPATDLLAIDSAWNAAVVARDEAAFLSRVAEDSVFAGATLQIGRTAIRVKWARYFAPAGPTLRWKPTDSGLAGSDDLGWTIGDASHEWKEKGVPPSPGRYLTVWARDRSGRWMAMLDGSLEPAPPTPSVRTPVRTLVSRDGRLEASVGTWRRGSGAGSTAGTFLLVREKRDGAWRTTIESEIPAPPGG